MTDPNQLKKHFINILFKVKKIDVCGNTDLALPLGEMVVLKRLFSNDCSDGNCMNTSEIHQNLYISKPAVSQILNSLENKGYINRYIDTRDRRRIMVSATPKAFDALRATEASVDEKMNRIMSEFGEENMTMLIDQLTSLCEIYDKIQYKSIGNKIK